MKHLQLSGQRGCVKCHTGLWTHRLADRDTELILTATTTIMLAMRIVIIMEQINSFERK